MEDERILHPDIDQMSPSRAGSIQARLVQLSVEQAKLLSPKRVIRRVGKGSSFKNGYSPQFMVLKASLHAHVDIRRLIWKHTRERSDKDGELDYILSQWRSKRLRFEEQGTHTLKATYSHVVVRSRTSCTKISTRKSQTSANTCMVGNDNNSAWQCRSGYET